MVLSFNLRLILLKCRKVADRPRDRAQWSEIKAVVDALKIPVIANGDVLQFGDVERIKKATGESKDHIHDVQHVGTFCFLFLEDSFRSRNLRTEKGFCLGHRSCSSYDCKGRLLESLRFLPGWIGRLEDCEEEVPEEGAILPLTLPTCAHPCLIVSELVEDKNHVALSSAACL